MSVIAVVILVAFLCSIALLAVVNNARPSASKDNDKENDRNKENEKEE